MAAVVQVPPPLLDSRTVTVAKNVPARFSVVVAAGYGQRLPEKRIVRGTVPASCTDRLPPSGLMLLRARWWRDAQQRKNEQQSFHKLIL